MFRFAVLTLLFCIFVYQMNNSIVKYYARPIVQEISTKKVKDLQEPAVYICQVDYYNYEAATEYGYTTGHQTGFALGHNRAGTTWKGSFGNQSYRELQNKLFINILTSSLESGCPAIPVFTEPFGNCMKLEKTLSYAEVNTTIKSIFMMVDPYMANRIRITEIENTRIEFGPVNEEKTLFDSSHFEIRYKLYDRTIDDGETCTHYEKIGSSYGECIEEAMKAKLIEVYQCLPPWFPDSKGSVCEDDKKIEMNSELGNILFYDMYHIPMGTDLEMFEGCLKPCVSIGVNMKRTAYRTNRRDKSWFRYKGIDILNHMITQK